MAEGEHSIPIEFAQFALDCSPVPTARLVITSDTNAQFLYRNPAWHGRLGEVNADTLVAHFDGDENQPEFHFPFKHRGMHFKARALRSRSHVMICLNPEHADSDTQLRLRLLENAFDACTAGITITEQVGREHLLRMANPAFCKLTGYTVPEMLNHDLRFLQGEAEQPSAAKLRHAIDNQQSARVDLVNFHKNGEPYEIDLHIAPVNNNGQNRFYIGVQLDITRQRIAERQREESDFKYAELERMLLPVQRKAVAAEMGDSLIHQLAQPVSAMSNYCNALKHLIGDDNERVDQVLERLSAMTERCRQSIDHTRKLFLLAPEQASAIDIAEVVRTTTALLERKYQQRDIALLIDLPDKLPVKASASEVELLLFTLLRSLLVMPTVAPESVQLKQVSDSRKTSIMVSSQPKAALQHVLITEWSFLLGLFEATGVQGERLPEGLVMRFLKDD
jgi:PAS domain S-box-containing protein